MNSLDSVRREILRLVKTRGNTALVRTQQLSRFYNVPEKLIRKDLIELAQQKLIRLFQWDGQQMRSYEASRNAEQFIEPGTDGGYLRIEIGSL